MTSNYLYEDRRILEKHNKIFNNELNIIHFGGPILELRTQTKLHKDLIVILCNIE